MTNMKAAISNTVSITDVARNVSKVFAEAKESPKLVIKNNKPEILLMSIEEYDELIDTLQDFEDYVMAMERVEANKDKKLIDSETFWKKFNITDDDVKDIEVEFE